MLDCHKKSTRLGKDDKDDKDAGLTTRRLDHGAIN